MKRRQTATPRQWLIADERLDPQLWDAVRRLPRGSGILLLYRGLGPGQRTRLKSRLQRIARRRGLALADEGAGEARRVHDLGELRRAGLERVPLLFLSPMLETRSHPEWKPLARMTAAALVRLAKVPVIALGGMSAIRFARVKRLGFQGWAGIDAFRT